VAIIRDKTMTVTEMVTKQTYAKSGGISFREQQRLSIQRQQ